VNGSIQELQLLYSNLHKLSEADQRVLLRQLDAFEKLRDLENCRDNFLAFVKKAWPIFIAGKHHAKMAAAFEKVAKGELKRLIINMPPRHTKSEFASWLLPAWFLGKNPEKKIIQTSHTAELATGFGRKVRNLVSSEVFSEVFPNVSLQADSKAAGRWNTNKGGDYFAIGVGGAVTGKGADILIIDDPHSEQEAALADTSPEIYDKVYEWYTSGPRQRLQPGGSIIIVMCMTGDTPVLMANGREKPLKDIRPGDLVATFDNGKLLASRVNNWRSSGVDSIYKIQTQSGRTLRANERHPFLVMNEGVLEWTRLRHLKQGDLLVSLKDAADLLRQNSDFTAEKIVSITPDGDEEVFDVEVDKTENFIANGFVSHNTRWSQRDLTAQVLKAATQRGGEEWEVIEFPAILPSGNPLWPEFWSLQEMEALREELPSHKWNAQYQQAPTSREGALVKPEWWNMWEADTPPKCDYIIQSWDTAFEKNNRADYSACTTWGIFYNDRHKSGKPVANAILLDAFKERMEFPELKKVALDHWKSWKPDSFIVEKKASGAPLIYEFRASGIPVQEYTPSRGQDKIARLNSVADLFASGMVWAPRTAWAEEVVDEVAAFPSGEHDDYVDALTLALMRFRSGGFIATEIDEPDPVRYFKSHRGTAYY
jgi:hypothetical protein